MNIEKLIFSIIDWNVQRADRAPMDADLRLTIDNYWPSLDAEALGRLPLGSMPETQRNKVLGQFAAKRFGEDFPEFAGEKLRWVPVFIKTHARIDL